LALPTLAKTVQGYFNKDFLGKYNPIPGHSKQTMAGNEINNQEI
jgi:hypothetical protein